MGKEFTEKDRRKIKVYLGKMMEPGNNEADSARHFLNAMLKDNGIPVAFVDSDLGNSALKGILEKYAENPDLFFGEGDAGASRELQEALEASRHQAAEWERTAREYASAYQEAANRCDILADQLERAQEKLGEKDPSRRRAERERSRARDDANQSYGRRPGADAYQQRPSYTPPQSGGGENPAHGSTEQTRQNLSLREKFWGAVHHFGAGAFDGAGSTALLAAGTAFAFLVAIPVFASFYTFADNIPGAQAVTLVCASLVAGAGSTTLAAVAGLPLSAIFEKSTEQHENAIPGQTSNTFRKIGSCAMVAFCLAAGLYAGNATFKSFTAGYEPITTSAAAPHQLTTVATSLPALPAPSRA